MTVCPRVSYSARNCKDLRLSRFNHWRPWGQAHPEGVQGTAAFHDQITDPLLPQADPVLHDAAALDTAMDMLDPQPPLIERLVRPWKRHKKVAVHPCPAPLCLQATRGRGRALSCTKGSRCAQRAIHARA